MSIEKELSLELKKFFFFGFWCTTVCLHSFKEGFEASSFVCLRMVAFVGEHLEIVGRLSEDQRCKFPIASSAH